MFPVHVTVNTPEQLKALWDSGILGDAPAAPVAAAAAPAKVKAKATPAAAAPAAPAPTTPAVPSISDAGKAFLQNQLAEPVQRLSMTNEPAMKAIVAEYGVERVSLIPEKLFPEVLVKVQNALDPGAAERARLEAIDKAREGAAPARSLL